MNKIKSLLSAPSLPRYDVVLEANGSKASAKSPPAFVGRSMGIMHFPALLPRQKAQAVRMQIIDRLLDTYPALRTATVDCTCDPLFITPSSDHAFTRDIDSEGVVWCDTSTGGLSSVKTRGTCTLLGLNSLSEATTLSPSGSLSFGGDVYQQNIEPLSLLSSASSEPGSSYGSVNNVSLANSSGVILIGSDRSSISHRRQIPVQ